MRTTPDNTSIVIRWLIMASMVAAAFGLRWSARGYLDERIPLMFFFFAAAGATWFSGLVPGMVAMAIGGVLGLFFFVPPSYMLSVRHPLELTLLANYALTTCFCIALIENLRRRNIRTQAIADEAEAQASRLRDEVAERQSIEQEVKRLNLDLESRIHEFETLLRLTPVGIAITYDQQARDVRCNAALMRMLGINAGDSASLKPQESSIRSFQLYRNNAPLALDELPMRRAARGEAVEPEDLEIRRVDGELIYVLCLATTLRDAQGRPRGAVGSFIDITDRKLARDALLAQEKRLRFLINQMPAVLWSVDASLRFTSSLGGALLLQPKQTEGLSLTDYYGDSDSNLMAVTAARRALAGEKVSFEVHRNGRFIESHVEPLRDGLGRIIGAIGVGVDNTERRHAEQALRNREQQLRLALLEAKMVAWEWDLATNYAYASLGSHQLLSTSEGSVEDFFANVHPDDAESTLRWRQRVRGGEAMEEHEFRQIDEKGDVFWMLTRGKLDRDASGKPIRMIGITIDITDRKRAEIELERAKREAEGANKAKDNFLATLSHELRTPLMPALMLTSALGDSPALTESVRADINLIRRNIELEARLIDDLLDLTRITRGKLELDLQPVDAHELIEQAVEICRPDITQRGIRLSMELGAVRRLLLADPARVQQIVWNIVKNAVKFTPAGGSIWVRSFNREPSDADAPPPERGGFGSIVIEIGDTGVGIDAQTLPRLFTAFEQGDRSITRTYGGLGLGLAISRALAEMHGGTIVASSAGSSRGATFTVELPLSASDAMPFVADNRDDFPMNEAATDMREPFGILLVEDHADTARLMSRLLRADGYTVESASSVSTALETAERSRGRINLVISDLGLPDGSGLDLMRQLAANSALKGIALSGFGMDEDVLRSREAGFVEHLTKPVNLDQLRSAIRRVRIEMRGGKF